MKRKHIFIWLFAWLLTNCTTPYIVQKGSIQDIPLVSPTEDALLFFEDEKPQGQGWLKVSYVTVVGSPRDSYNDLVAKMKDKAKRQGFDGVVNVRQGISRETDTNVVEILAGIDGEEYSAKTLSGIGIKYLKNLNYIEQVVKTQKMYRSLPDSLYSEWMANGHFDFRGKLIQVKASNRASQRLYEQKIHLFSLHRLLGEKEGWTYRNDSFGRVIVRKKQEDSAHRVKIEYDAEGNVDKVLLSHNFRDYSIVIKRDALNRVSEKDIYLDGQHYLHETFQYDDKDRVVNSAHEDLLSSLGKQTYYCEYAYHSLGELKSMRQVKQ